MKITVRSKEKGFTILFPSCIVFSRLAATILCKVLAKKMDRPLSAKQFYPLLKLLKRYRGFPLVEVKSADGERVCIRL